MRRAQWRKIAQYARNGRYRSIWHKLVRAMACLVVFCTTYALILPAITAEKTYFCQMEAHQHSSECYKNDTQRTLVCQLPELTAHTHGDDCYEADALVCTLQEFTPHTHGVDCVDEAGELQCTEEEAAAHEHGNGCYNEETHSVLICEREEHIHQDVCRIDPNADLESPEDWEETLDHVDITGDWAKDLTAIAATQIGYRESEKNYLPEDGGAGKGYTRYGAWYGTPYGEWDSMFVSFCLHYAQIPRDAIPWGSDSEVWQEKLRENDLTGAVMDKVPESGDLLFYTEVESDTVHAAIVAAFESQKLRLIEGGRENQVTQRQVSLESVQILGCCGIKQVQQRWNALYNLEPANLESVEATQETRPVETTEETDPTETTEEADPTETTEEADPTETAEEADPTETTEEADPTETTEETDPTETTEETDPTETTEEADPTETAEETDPTETTEEADPTETTEETNPTETTEETDPTETAEETDPTETTEEADPTETTGETAPIETAEATEPLETTESTEPALRICQTAETENYYVTVSYDSTLVLPEGARLRVVEYSKDSDIFRQRCLEAGYELEWLLNIGFFLEEQEIPLDGAFDVLVTSKHGKELGPDITHFADTGAERITGTDASEKAAEGQTAVLFPAAGFSDFGGGVAVAAVQPEESPGISLFAVGEVKEADSFTFITADPANLSEGKDYVIYYPAGNDNFRFLGSDLSDILASGTGYWSSPTIIGNSWNVSADKMGTTFASDIAWRVIKSGNQYYLESQKDGRRLVINRYSLGLSNGGSALTNTASGSGATIRSGNNYARYSNGFTGTSSSYYATTLYFAEVKPAYRNYPDAVYTGQVHVDRLRFYNLCEGIGNGVAALPGCVFRVEGTTASGAAYTTEIISGNDPQIALPNDIPDGKYTITEVSAPDGYMRDINNVREFWIEDGALVSEHNIGTFLNHTLEKLTVSKTGEVEDYNNRIYQIMLNAKTNLRMYEMDPIDVLFVVDKSNSMLFPSGMDATGKSITLQKDGQNNVSRNQQVLDSLDKSKMHYIIADPQGTSTVYAVWHDGTAWLYQDASYYAKAMQNNGEGYQSSGEVVIFPGDRSYADQSDWEDSTYGEEYRSNGGGLNRDFGSSSLGNYIGDNGGSVSFQLYTAQDEYNRLHYLEQALANMIYELADANPQNRVTLIPFTKEVQGTIYYPVGSSNAIAQPVTLTTSNAEMLVDIVTHIDTTGGTRQDLALEHTMETYLNRSDRKDKDHTYTILITDGAPVRSGSSAPSLGNPNSAATTADNGTIYGRIKGWAEQVRNRSTLMTVALGMEYVEGGKAVLEDIASSDEFYCALDDASNLTEAMHRILFDGMKDKGELYIDGTIRDEISDSFYPIAWTEPNNVQSTNRKFLSQSNGKAWILPQAGDWITLDGKFTTAGASDAAGQILKREDGTYCIQWQEQPVSGAGWKGSFYVKAREDFIGGNAIDTNKSAQVIVNDATKNMETPTVNVHLLEMNENSSEVTVYLGDTVNNDGSSPKDVLQAFYQDIRFTKLIADGGSVTNRLSADQADGLEEAAFYLNYAFGYRNDEGQWISRDLTDDEWATLEAGGSLTVPYVYDDASSHGNVGYFTISLNKTSDTYLSHQAQTACQPEGRPPTEQCEAPAERYSLTVTYTAYELGEQGRPEGNQNNGTGSPGTEVTKAAGGLNNGQGILTSDNVHEVHVISGKIVVKKLFTQGTQWTAGDTFTFQLTGPEDAVQTQTVTIGADGTAVAVFDNLKRGTYTVAEAMDEDYAVKAVTIGGGTNCYATQPDPMEATFTMGHNPDNQDVIGKASESDAFTSYIDPYNGVYGEAEFANAPRIFTGEVPVEKIWDDGAEQHPWDQVYLVLYKDDQPVLDTDGNTRLLRLDADSGWKGVFTVVLASRNDSVKNYNYSVREVSGISAEALYEWKPAILENDGTTLLYYQRALEQDGLLGVGGKGYIVQYGTSEEGVLQVTNLKGYDLPETGGAGTHMYTFSGLTLIGASLMYGYSLRRKRERGASS